MLVVAKGCVADKLERFLHKVESPINKEPSYRHLVKADALRIKNHFFESIDEYLKALKYDNTNIEAFTGLGLAYKQIGYAKSAISTFNSAKRLNPFDKSLYFEVGCCYCMEQKFCCAIKEYQKAIKLCPDFIDAHLNLALAYELIQNNDLAMKEYKKIIEKNPEYIQAYNNLGSLYMKLDIYAHAIKTFRNLLKINPDYSRAYLGIAISLDKTNEKDKALRYYRKYLKLKPNSDNVPQIIERIFELKEQKASTKSSHLELVS